MPSGSGHSGGGHFGGGGSSSGGHFGGGHDYGGHSSPPMFHHGMRGGRSVFFFNFGGRRYYANSRAGGIMSVFIVLFFISIFACFFFGITMGNYSADLDKIKSDYERYSTMSSRAISNSNYQIDGTFVDYKQYNNSGKYCVFYTYEAKDYLNQVYQEEGYTFYTFTWEQVQEFMDEGKIKLAASSYKDHITGITDTIDLYYSNTTLEDDAEYVDYSSKLNTFKILLIVSGCVAGGLLIGTIVIGIKSMKRDVEEENSTVSNTSKQSAATYENSTSYTRTNNDRKCKYCGATLKDGQSHCDRCGGSV